MYSFLAALLLCWSVDALLYPLNNGQEPEPELLMRCPVPRNPIGGSITCDYSIFRMKCTAQCNGGHQFEDGSGAHFLECDLFDGFFGNLVIPACVPSPTTSTLSGTQTTPTAVVVTGTCIKQVSDCVNVMAKDYQLCNHCRLYATCASSGFFIRQCPGLSVFDSSIDKCVSQSTTCSYKTK